MAMPRPNPDFLLLRRLQRFKQSGPRASDKLGDQMISFFKQCVSKRQTKLGKIAENWARLVPETLSARCALESLNRGTLTVLVDSSSHLYELKQLLLAGLQQQLLLACKAAGLRKIVLRHGQWYREDGGGQPKPRFA
jgi:Dna[CI] antecedent, DciA